MNVEEFMKELGSLTLSEALEIGEDLGWFMDCVPYEGWVPEHSSVLSEMWKNKVSNTSPEEWHDFLNSDPFFGSDFLYSDYFSESILDFLVDHICEENCYVLEKFSTSDYMILSWNGPRPEHNLFRFLNLDFTKDLFEKDNHTENELIYLSSIIFEAYEHDVGVNARNTNSSVIFKIAEIMLKNKHREGLDKLASVCIWGQEIYYSVSVSEAPLGDLLREINAILGTNHTRLSDREREENLDGILDYTYDYDDFE